MELSSQLSSECRLVLSGLERQAVAIYLLWAAAHERSVVRNRYEEKVGSL